MKNTVITGIIYNTYLEATRFVDSLMSQLNISTKLILIDNSCIEPSDSFIQRIKENPHISYLKQNRNLGYFGGAQVALEFCSQRLSSIDFFIVSNVDIIYSPDFVASLLNLKVNEEVGVIAPSIISNKWQIDANPKILERYSRKRMLFYKYLYMNRHIHNFYILLSYLKKLFKHRGSLAENFSRYIYAPHGSCIIFLQKYFNSGLNFNHISFLFGEEIFIAEECSSKNIKVLYEPNIKVLDFEHASTGIFYNKKISDFMKQSTIDIIQKYYARN